MKEGMSLSQWVAQAAQSFDAAKAAASENTYTEEVYPDGKYVGQLSKLMFGMSKKGNYQVIWNWVCAAGPYKGKVFRRYDGMDREDAMTWLLRDIAKYGYDLGDVTVDSLDEIFVELEAHAPLTLLTFKTKNDRQYIYVDRVGDEQDVIEYGYAPKEEYIYSESSVPADFEPEVVPEAPEETELQVGMRVKFSRSGVEKIGEITNLDEEDNEVSVKVGGKTYVMDPDDLEVLPD